jgi:predicted amidophosphoribosyltransferase
MEGRFRGLGIERVNAAVRAVGRTLFPHRCVACDREGAILCAGCESEIVPPLRGVFVCPACGEPSPLGSRCGRRACAASPIDAAVAAAPYAHPALRALLAAWKFERVDEAGAAVRRCFGAFVRRHRAALSAAAAGGIVVPVPMHPVRRAMRGFDQADALASAFGAELGLRTDRGLLVRRWRWMTQASLGSADERSENARGSVAASTAAPGACVLVDDVMTTGATLKECASVLKRAGAGRVVAVTFLKG